MTAPYVGRQVEVTGLASRPDLNGRVGTAQSFNEATGRYNVVVSGELLALKPINVIVVVQGEPVPPAAAARQADPGRAQGGGAGPGFQPPAGLHPKGLAMAFAAVLVLVLGVPVLTAALLAGLGLLGHSAARREGGLLPALRMCARRAQAGLERLTGRPASTAQAAYS